MRLYIFAGTVLLAAARLYQGQTTNMRTPGGGFAPALEVRSALEGSVTGVRLFASGSLVVGGLILMAVAFYFGFLQPLLLPEDAKHMGASLAQTQISVPRLEHRLRYRPVDRLCLGDRLKPGVAAIVAVSRLEWIGWMAIANFLTDSDLKWPRLAFTLPWVTGLTLPWAGECHQLDHTPMHNLALSFRTSARILVYVIGLGLWFAPHSFAQQTPVELAEAGFLAKDRGQFPLAIRLFDQALQQGHFEVKQRGLILYGRGVSYEALGSRERALADFDAAIALLPALPNAYLYRGIIWGDAQQYEKALQDFQTAGRLNPNDPLVFNNLGNVYERLGALDRAIENYGRAIGLRADDAKAYYNRAHAYVLKGDNEHALADYDTALLLQPNYKDAYINRGVLHLMGRNLANALYDLDAALRLDPRDVTALFNHARINLAMEKYDVALSDFDRALAISPGSAGLYLARGQAHLFAGADVSSIADFMTAVRIRPSSAYPAIWLHIARVHGGEEDREEITRNVKNVQRDIWPSAVLDLYVGTQNKENVLAAAQKGRVDNKAERECEVRFFLGEFSLHNGGGQQAREALQEVLSSCGPEEGVYSAAIAESKLLPKP